MLWTFAIRRSAPPSASILMTCAALGKGLPSSIKVVRPPGTLPGGCSTPGCLASEYHRPSQSVAQTWCFGGGTTHLTGRSVRWILLGICPWTRVRGDPEKGVGQWLCCVNRGAGGFTHSRGGQATFQKTGIPRLAMRLITVQAIRASTFCADRVRARRLQPIKILYLWKAVSTSARLP
jgi:hypothetical protein